MPSIKNVQPLVKGVLIPLELTAAAAAAKAIDAAIQKKLHQVGFRIHTSDLANQTALIISNEEMNDLIKVIKPLEGSGLLIRVVSETIKKWSKRTKRWISQHDIWYIGAISLGNLLAGKGLKQ